MRPVISVIVEGYNESSALGTVADAIDGLKRQDFPLNQVELILVGSSAQCSGWNKMYAREGLPFFRVRTVCADGAHYYELKNRGAINSSGQILAFTDSDTQPQPAWLSSIHRGITNGADVVAGVSLFRGESGWQPGHPLMQVAASISWGFIIGKAACELSRMPNAFLSHNLAVRSKLFLQNPFRTDLGRTCAGSFLYRTLVESGAKILLQPEQQIAHNFSLGWWLKRLHVRFGYEVFLLRRIDLTYPNKWLARMKILEPLASMLWHILLDIPQWLRFGKLLGLNRSRRFGLLPFVFVMSSAARGAEMFGMYATLFAPGWMKRRAEAS